MAELVGHAARDEQAPSDDEAVESEQRWRSPPDDAPRPRPSHRRCVVHVDLDCFYAQVEMLERPELRDRPLGVQQKNIVVTCNYVARARGVTKCCSVSDALRVCPQLVLVNGSDLTRYRRMSARVHRLLARFSRRVERLGFDENFLDVTEAMAAQVQAAPTDVVGHVYAGRGDSCTCGCQQLLSAASHVAAAARRALHDELGITSCAGVGFNKLLAKLAGAAHKPNAQTTVLAGGVDALLAAAGPVRRLPGVGSRSAGLLASMGVETVQQLRDTAVSRLEPVLGAAAAAVRALAFGADETEVKTSSAAISIGVEDGFKRVDNVAECELKVRELTRRVLLLLREDGRVPTVLKLSVRRYDKDNYYRFRETRQTKVTPSLFARCDSHDDVAVANRVVSEAMVLLRKMLKEPFHLTLIGLAVTGFPDQLQGAETAGIARYVQTSAAPTSGKRKQSHDCVAGGSAPVGVDETVWAGLPSDIQSELMAHQLGPSRKRKQQSIVSYFGASPASNCTTKDALDSSFNLNSDQDGVAEDSLTSDGLAEAVDVAQSTCTSLSRYTPQLGTVERPHDGLGSHPDDSHDFDDPGSPVVSRSVASGSGGRAGTCVGSSPEESTESARRGGPSDLRPRARACDGCDIGGDTAESPVVWPSSGGESAGRELAAAGLAPTGDGDTSRARDELAAAGLAPTGDGDTSRARDELAAAGLAPTGDGDTSRARDGAGLVPPIATAPQEVARDAAGLLSSADDQWDPDVFCQLPPDIQFELKMARRAQRSQSGPSPRRPAMKTGPFERFLKKL